MGDQHAAAALSWWESGGCPVPVATDRTKRPAINWRAMQTQRPTREEVVELFAKIDSDGVGTLTGNRLEMIELEGRAIEQGLGLRILARLEELGLLDLWHKIMTGYCERTPGKGLHTFIWVSDGEALPNTRLACTASNDVLIETRGEGGFAVVAPSNGRSHPSGGAWEIMTGGPATIAHVTSDERDALYAALADFDERQRVISEPQHGADGPDVGARPGDDFNARVAWADVIGPYGWVLLRKTGDVCYWRKPGKRKPGCSATTGRDEHDRLYVFSTATEFEPNRPYTKFGAYALLAHGGDYSAAARALRQQGFGGSQGVGFTSTDAERLRARQIDAGDAPDASDEHAIDLEELFWTSRPVLAHLRQAAYSRIVSPWAVFGCALVRVICTVPPWIVLPPLIGGEGSLNSFVALVGPPGSGKSGAMICARDALLFDSALTFPTLPLGSGEGLVRTFAEYDTKAKALVQIETSALFVADEVDTLRALFERSGATLGGQLKSAYVGGGLGFANANRERRVYLEPHSYRLGLVVGVQPGKGRALLDDADGGTPQRFVWLPTIDPRLPDQLPDWPTPLTLSAQQWSGRRMTLAVPDQVAAEITASHRAAARGERDLLDGHALFAREKIAQGLALLDGRRVMTFDDWDLAGIVMAVSTRTRTSVVEHIDREQQRKAEQRAAARIDTTARAAAAADRSVRRQAVERVATNVLRKLADGELSAGVLRAKIAKRDRDLLDDATELLISQGKVSASDTKQGGRMLRRL